jgi:hypothetical protein
MVSRRVQQGTAVGFFFFFFFFVDSIRPLSARSVSNFACAIHNPHT